MKILKSPHTIAVAGLALVTLIVFHSVLLPPKPVVASDAPLASQMAYRRNPGRTVQWSANGYLGRGGSIRQYGLGMVKLLAPVKYSNTLFFPLAVFMVGLGFYLFCLSQGLGPLAAFTGAASLMLSGHFLTCVMSGHTGKFLMWACLCFALWLLTLGIRRRSILAIAWSGVAAGIGVSCQLDVGSIIMLFLGAWAAFLIWQTRAKKAWLKLSAGLIIAAMAGSVYCASSVYSLMGLAAQSSDGAGGETRSAEEKWNWATQWSLPRVETLTFVAPGFFGFGVGDSPYWGRIGQDARWPEHHVGFPRFSMSTQNMGIVVVALALLAIIAAPRMNANSRKVIYFWAVALVIALVFSWGRYFDLGGASASGVGPYRLFYSLPKMDAMRNPMKFLYPFMLALSILAAYGMEQLIAITNPRKRKN